MTAPKRATLAIVAAALALRLALLVVRGDYVVYDEGYYLLLARSLAGGHGFSMNGLPHVALSPLMPVIVAGLALAGVPDLWASRLLAAAAGALLVLPVGFLARRWYGERAALAAGVFVAVSPALLTYLPFFPGERWNLYFGSEPLFLLLGTSAIVSAIRATDGGGWRWWISLGALAAASYLTRLEGAVLGLALAGASLAALVARGKLTLLPRAIAGAAIAAITVTPYLLYLHGALGRWAASGRVQAAVSASVVEAPAVPDEGGGSDAVRAFVWGGDQEALWRTLYALDESGTRMASQYWGVPPLTARLWVEGEGGPPRSNVAGEGGGVTPQRALTGRSNAEPPRLSPARVAWRAVNAVLPWWFLALAFGCVLWPRLRGDSPLWLAPMLLTSVVPSILAYVEPRALLLLVPLACVLAAGIADGVIEEVTRRWSSRWFAPAIVGVLALGLLAPSARDLIRAWPGTTPLQRVAAARRAVGEYLGTHLPADAVIVSWHPAIGVFSGREWRVLPFESFERIVGYAHAQRASALVFSRFEPSPLRAPPRAFTIVLIDSTSAAAGTNVQLDRVDETPLVFVGRLAPEPGP